MGGGKGLATKKKLLFLKLEKNIFPNKNIATKLERGLSGRATKKITFFFCSFP